MVNTKNFIILKFYAKFKSIRDKLYSFSLTLNAFCFHSVLNIKERFDKIAQQYFDLYCSGDPNNSVAGLLCEELNGYLMNLEFQKYSEIQNLQANAKLAAEFKEWCNTSPNAPEKFCEYVDLIEKATQVLLGVPIEKIIGKKESLRESLSDIIETFVPEPIDNILIPFDSILFSNSYTILPSLVFLLCFLIFLIGLAGLVVVNNNLLIILMSIEIMFFGLGLFTIFFSLFVTNASGFIIALVMITTSAAETVIGLSLLVRYCVLLDNITVSRNIVNPYLN